MSSVIYIEFFLGISSSLDQWTFDSSVFETRWLGAGKTNSGMGHQKLRPDLVYIVYNETDLDGGDDRLCCEGSGDLSLGYLVMVDTVLE